MSERCVQFSQRNRRDRGGVLSRKEGALRDVQTNPDLDAPKFATGNLATRQHASHLGIVRDDVVHPFDAHRQPTRSEFICHRNRRQDRDTCLHLVCWPVHLEVNHELKVAGMGVPGTTALTLESPSGSHDGKPIWNSDTLAHEFNEDVEMRTRCMANENPRPQCRIVGSFLRDLEPGSIGWRDGC